MVALVPEQSEFVTEFWAAFAWTPVHQGFDGIRVAFASITPIIASRGIGNLPCSHRNNAGFPADDGFVRCYGQYGGHL